MKVTDIRRVACVGGGVIGSSWAIQFAMRGLDVTLYDINDEQLKKSEGQMHKSLDALENFNAITPERRAEIVARIRLTTSMEEAVKDAQFIQESGPERLEIKQSILAQAEQSASPEAVYASSTSGLLISDIAAKAAELEQWGRSIILLFPDETAYAKYAASPAASLPQTVTFGIDRDGSVRRQILDAMHLPGNVPLPVFIVGDTFNRVVFESHGYTIGLGDRFLHTIHQL